MKLRFTQVKTDYVFNVHVATADAKHILFECQKGAVERPKFMNKMSSLCPIYNQML